jgi:hypothetical protein
MVKAQDAPGDRAIAEFSGIGRVEVNLTKT